MQKDNHQLNAKDGLIIGCDGKNNYHSDGHEALLLMAPTGTGKGVSFVIPNLLSWRGSAIVHDIKLENYEITSGWRASLGQKIYLFNPLEPTGKTHGYNPLDFVSKNPGQMFSDVEKMAALLLSSCHKGHDEHLHNQDRRLFIGLALYVLAHPTKPKTFGEIFRMLAGDLAAELSDGIKNFEMHPNGLMLINSFLNVPEKKRYQIVSGLACHLELWSNPLVDKATSRSDFNPAAFRREKATLYVGLHPGDIDVLKPLMRFFYQHVMQGLFVHDTEAEHGLLLLLDDFPSIGRMEILHTSTQYLRGYNVRLAMIAQDLNDIKSTYCDKGAHSLINNSRCKIAFTPNASETAEFIASLSLMDSKEVMKLPLNQQIVLTDEGKQVVLDKLRYYDIKELKDRVIGHAALKFR